MGEFDGFGQAFFVCLPCNGLPVSAFRGFDDGKGQYADSVSVGFHKVSAVRPGVTPNRVGNRGLLEEVADIVGRVERDTDHIDAAFFLGFVPFGHHRHLFAARAAPSCPKVDDADGGFERLQALRGTVFPSGQFVCRGGMCGKCGGKGDCGKIQVFHRFVLCMSIRVL